MFLKIWIRFLKFKGRKYKPFNTAKSDKLLSKTVPKGKHHWNIRPCINILYICWQRVTLALVKLVINLQLTSQGAWHLWTSIVDTYKFFLTLVTYLLRLSDLTPLVWKHFVLIPIHSVYWDTKCEVPVIRTNMGNWGRPKNDEFFRYCWNVLFPNNRVPKDS